MSKSSKKWLTFALRWSVAVVGVYLVVKNIAFRDRVIVLDATGRPVEALVLGYPRETDAVFHVVMPGDSASAGGAVRDVSRDDIWAKADRSTVEVRDGGGVVRKVKLLAVHPGAGAKAAPTALIVQDRQTEAIRQIEPAALADLPSYLRDYIPYPLIEIGLKRMVHEADPRYLLAALAVVPIAFLLTSYRWHLLLEALAIHIGLGRTFVINMVGAFYNTFMPGSTGGDLVKAYYASKHTPHRTWSVISVLMDRAIGLLALVMLGGFMAALQWNQIPACRKVAIASGAILLCVAVGLVVFYVPALRRATGLNFLLKRLPMQKQVRSAVEGLEMYGHHRPLLSLLALLLCFPVHMTSIVSAMLIGHAFGLALPPLYYWVVVPVIALVGAIPISPQGAGVMEGFAILLTRRQGVTISQAVALTLAIRLVQIFWNLIAGVFVLRGGYHAPTETEQHELEGEEEEGSGFGVQGSEEVGEVGRAAVHAD